MFLRNFFENVISTKRGVVVLVAIALLLGVLFFWTGGQLDAGNGAEPASSEVTKVSATAASMNNEDDLRWIKDSYRVKEGSSFDIQKKTQKPASFSSVDQQVISVDTDGDIKGKAPGETYVIAMSDEDPLNEEYKFVKVTVYPEKLRAPRVKVKEKEDNVVLVWNEVPYADKYEVMRYSSSEEKFVSYEKTEGRKIKVPYGKAKYVVRALTKLDDGMLKGVKSDVVELHSIVEDLPAYDSIHEIRSLGEDDLELVAKIEGVGSARIPQSFCYTGEEYLITFVDTSGGNGTLVSYGEEGERISERKVDMGHVNGSTYKKDTDRIYTVVTHRQHRSDDCEAYDLDDLSKTTFELPRITSGIAYDASNDSFYLSGGPKVMVTGTDFQSDKVIMKKRYHQAQDIGAFDGAALVAVWPGGDTSYVDMYRVSDDSYIGSYSLPFGEIESVTAVDGHLVVLMHSARFGGETGDFILRSKALIGK